MTSDGSDLYPAEATEVGVFGSLLLETVASRYSHVRCLVDGFTPGESVQYLAHSNRQSFLRETYRHIYM